MILLGLKSASRISISQLCDDDCDVLLNRSKLIVIENKEIILQENWNFIDGLWDMPVYNNSFTQKDYKLSQQHAAIYLAKPRIDVLNSATTSFKKKIKNTRHLKLPRDFWYFDQLINDNIDFIPIEM